MSLRALGLANHVFQGVEIVDGDAFRFDLNPVAGSEPVENLRYGHSRRADQIGYLLVCEREFDSNPVGRNLTVRLSQTYQEPGDTTRNLPENQIFNACLCLL